MVIFECKKVGWAGEDQKISMPKPFIQRLIRSDIHGEALKLFESKRMKSALKGSFMGMFWLI
jgi:hypothetical protein